MSTPEIHHVLSGALAMASWVAGLFFLRFWRSSRDRLFVFFFLAFWLFALDWLAMAVVAAAEIRQQMFIVRLLAFLLIIAGVIDKNRRGRPQ